MYTYKKDSYFKDNTGIEVLFHTIAKHEPEHLHEFIEMVYILHGSGVHGIDGVEYDLKPGSLLFINYLQVHYFRTDTEMEMCNILLDPEWISEKLIDSENAFELLTLSAFSYFSKDIITILTEDRLKNTAIIASVLMMTQLCVFVLTMIKNRELRLAKKLRLKLYSKTVLFARLTQTFV